MSNGMGKTMHGCVSLDRELIAPIDQMVGEEWRDRFVAEAVREQIRRRQIAALEAMAGSLADVDIPGWETPESTVEWGRRQRRGGSPLPSSDGSE